MSEASFDGAFSPPQEDGEYAPHEKDRRVGLTAALAFSILMWVFIGLAVAGLILKAAGHHH